uniref:RING-type E3 ubiquitin transferase n=1 Tax=Leersia perrieri TaxID=77586 RepID=A0A0D9WHP4_9ORYZ
MANARNAAASKQFPEIHFVHSSDHSKSAMAKARNAAAASSSPSSSPYSSSASDGEILRSLHRLARDLSAAEAPAPFLETVFAAISRRAKLLAAVFDDLLRCGRLPRSASLCLREVLLVLQRFKGVVADCSARSRMRLLLQADEVAARVRELQHDLATLLDLLPVPELGLADDVVDLLALASRQCRRSSPAADAAEHELKASVLALIQEVEREIVPERERLEGILEEVGINDPACCSDEIETLEREIGDRVAERWTSAMIALVGLLRYAKCVLFTAATPRPVDSKIDLDDDDAEPPSPPPDFRCPISLDLMRDPVVSASGQTYDRESITRWFGSGKSTCPKTGQVLTNLEIVPNKALKNLISRWCRENGVAAMEGSEPSKPQPAPVVTANKAALEAARMTASFLVKKLSVSFSPAAANRVVHEIRQLARSGNDTRAFIGEAGAVPLLVPLLLHSSGGDADTQLNAVTALLNLSILDANKKRIMHAEGAVEALCHVMGSGGGATWRAKENAAATVLSLASVHSYRRRLGRNARVVGRVVELVRTGPSSTKKDALAALLCLSGERENVGRLVEAGAAEVAVSAIGEEETAVAVLASLAKRGGAEAIVGIDGAVVRLVAELRRGTEWSRECAAAALVLLCRRIGDAVVAQVMSVSGVEWAIWELMATGTERARRKAASLGRACRRWAAKVAAAEQTTECPTTSDVTTTAITAA